MVVSRGMRSPKREVLNVAVGDSSRIIILNYVFGSPLSQQPVVWNEFSPGDLLGAAPDTDAASVQFFSLVVLLLPASRLLRIPWVLLGFLGSSSTTARRCFAARHHMSGRFVEPETANAQGALYMITVRVFLPLF